ncbi:MAG: prolyl oligopeptidase family serine peptidase [Nocardioidaceae bacterium]
MSQPSFPRQYARTRRFTLGVPRSFTISPDGGRVVFLRSRAGDDPVTCLWTFDVGSGEERLVLDPRGLADGEEELPPEERARRERSREQAGGVVAYATDRGVRLAVFALSGRLWLADLTTDEVRASPAEEPAVDPRPDPTGTRVAYVRGGALRVIGADGADDRILAEPDGPDVSWGLAEHIAAEEMGRTRGFWWSPDGSRLLVARVDNAPVRRWHIADPAHPGVAPAELPYPAAGTPNADVRLFVVGLDGSRVEVDRDRAALEYIVTAAWDQHALLVAVESRDQRTMRILEVDPETGTTTVRREDTDPDWLEIVPGVPALTASGRLVWTVDADDTRRLTLGGEPVTPPALQVRRVLDVDGETVLFSASTEPTEIELWTHGPEGAVRVGDAPGVYAGRRAGGTTVVTYAALDRHGTSAHVLRDGSEVGRIGSYAETPSLTPRVALVRAGERELRSAVLLPSWHEPGSGHLPVLLDPYGGPHAQTVLAARRMFLVSQWFAERGFAVVVADGRGTPGRGLAWERSIRGDMLEPVLADQVDALQGAAASYPDLDLSRVAIRGWSFGGYLAAAAVLRRPDVFHAAVAGAPVTEWLLYDTHYTERYLGDPQTGPETYDRCSLLGDAPKLERPLLLIHGLADDNVVAAHTLRLSSALLAAGRPHTVLPLSGVTHMASQEAVAENLLLLQVDFLKRSLGVSL